MNKLKKTQFFAVWAPGANFNYVFAIGVDASDIITVHPTVGVGLLHRVICVNNIIAVVVFIGAVLYHIVYFSVKLNFAAHRLTSTVLLQ